MKRKFNKEEVRELVWKNEVKRETGEDRRWTRNNRSIVEADDGKFYELFWEQGLTENQENEYPAQEANEVELKEYEKTITVKEWIVKK